MKTAKKISQGFKLPNAHKSSRNAVLRQLRDILLKLIASHDIDGIKIFFAQTKWQPLIQRLFIKHKYYATKTSQAILEEVFFYPAPYKALQVIANNIGSKNFGIILKIDNFKQLVKFFRVEKIREKHFSSEKKDFIATLTFLLALYSDTGHRQRSIKILDSIAAQFFSLTMKKTYVEIKSKKQTKGL